MSDRVCTLSKATEVDHDGHERTFIVAEVTALRWVTIACGRFVRPEEARIFAQQHGAEVWEPADA